MAEPEVRQKLAAILAADVAGYSRLMGEDEPATITAITDYRNIFREQIEANGGRVVDMAGDSILAVFDSAAGAVAAAVATQTALAERNAALEPARRMLFRIGVNLGDIREADDGTVYGDGVNVAARLEGLAEPGGVMISEFAYQQVRRNPDMAFADAGSHAVKNIADPVRAYRVLAPGAAPQKAPRRRTVLRAALAVAALVIAGIAFWQTQRPPAVETASVERMAHPLPEEPSIAVLPFDNLSATEEHDFVADGLSENIISALSQTRGMLVIARNSTFTYKGEAVKVQEVAEALGVRYVLEGSIQVVGERLRATAQLIDALTGNHLWSERYDRALDDVFAVQDDITLNVVSALQVQLTEGPHALVWRGGTKSLEAWSLFQRGRQHLLRFTSDGVAEARRLFEQAVAIDPTFALALAQIGNTHRLDVIFRFSANAEESLDQALSYAEQAVAIDNESPDAHVILALIQRSRGEYERAVEQAEIALRLGPNHGYVLGMAALALYPFGQPDRAIALMQQAMRLSPTYLNWYPMVIAESHLFAGRHEQALDALQAAGADVVPGWQARIRIASLGGLSRHEEARRAIAQRLEETPGYSIDSNSGWLAGPGAYPPEAVATYVSLLRAAGVPEHPPGAEAVRPVIAVLPFDALSEEPEQQFFADGIAEDIITRLARFADIGVIARNSSFRYRGESVDVRAVAQDLGATYVLEGSVRRSENDIRVIAQLLDADDGTHLWAETYDRDLSADSIFAIQDDITERVVGAIASGDSVISLAVVSASEGKAPADLASYECVLRAGEYWRVITPDAHLDARACLEHVIAEEPNYAQALARFAGITVDEFLFGFNPRPDLAAPLDRALSYARRAIELDPKSALAHWNLARTAFFRHDMGVFLEEADRAIELAPNDSYMLATAGAHLALSGSWERGRSLMAWAIALSPHHQTWYHFLYFYDAYRQGLYADALAAARRINMPGYFATYVVLAAVYGQLGMADKAADAVANLHELYPGYSIETWHERGRLWNHEDDLIERMAVGLRKAGLPEH